MAGGGPLDRQTGFEVTDEFRRFNQKYDMFNRAVWDEDVRSERSRKFFESYFTDLAQFRKVEGFPASRLRPAQRRLVYRRFHL